MFPSITLYDYEIIKYAQELKILHFKGVFYLYKRSLRSKKNINDGN